jgi:HSP20 family protein
MAKKGNWLPLQLPQEVDRLFDEIIHRPWGSNRIAAEWNPQLDLYETEQAFILEADLPGVKEQDVSVSVENGDLVLTGSRTFEQIRTSGNFYYRERRAGHFVRRLRLPASVDQTHIHATFRDGVLSVTLPKVSPERTPQL